MSASSQTPPGDTPIDGIALRRKLRRRSRLAQLSIAAERASRCLWPILAVVLVFLAFSSVGAWSFMSDAWRLGVLIALGGALAAAIGWGASKFRWPSLAEGRAVLDHCAPGRPISSYDEALALGLQNPASKDLWRAHKHRAAQAAEQTQAPAPDLRVGGARDPYALRFFAALSLAAAFLLGARPAPIADAFAPLSFTPSQPSVPPRLEAWITPPAYTGAPPYYLANKADRFGEYELPVGSELALVLFDSGEPAQLSQDGGEPQPLAQESEDEPYSATLTLTQETQVSLTLNGEQLAQLDITLIPDEAPSISIVEAPKRGSGGVVSFSFSSQDDYGLQRAWASLKLDPNARQGARFGALAETEVIEFDLPTPGVTPEPPEDASEEERRKALEEAATPVDQDFSDHPWIELPVIMTLHGVDGAGQTAISEEIRFTLPGKLFSEPMAKALIEQRGGLSWNLEHAPRALRILNAATRYPDVYFDDTGGYLLTRSAISKLSYALSEDRVEAEKDAIIERLYQAAARLEDGTLENVRERLNRLMRQLREALEDGATEEELSNLMSELRDAVREYMQALAELAERNPELFQEQTGRDSQTWTPDQLSEMLERMEDAARNGVTDEAQEMLSMLENLLNNLRPGGQSQAQQGQGGQPGQQGQQGQPGEGQSGEGAPGRAQGQQRRPGGADGEALNDMIGEQQRLAEDSYDQFQRELDSLNPNNRGEGAGRAPQEGENPGAVERPDSPNNQRGRPSLDELRQRQGALNDQIERFSRRRDENGEQTGRRDIDRALDEMREAERALRDGDAGRAADHQMRALDALRDSARDIAEADQGDGEGQENTAEERTTDPLGRPTISGGGSGGVGDNVQVPGAIDPTRARDIIDDLRRRLGERGRSPEELEYLERLLERFK